MSGKRKKEEDEAPIINLFETIGRYGEPRTRISWRVKWLLQNLGKSTPERSVMPLIKALNHHDPFVMQTAASSLGTIGDERAVEPLKRSLQGEDDGVRRLAMEALEKLAIRSKKLCLKSVSALSTKSSIC